MALINVERMSMQELEHMLPTDTLNKGYSLIWYNPLRMKRDPTILYLHGREVYQWSHDPTMGEVWEKIREIEETV